MIIFDLACTHGHRFEGWFSSTDDYEHQFERDLVRCPVCDDAQVSRVPSAKVRVGKSVEPAPAATVVEKPPAPQPQQTPIPAEFIAQLRAMVKGAEDVGGRFPEEARKIHYDESPARSIRGKASAEEAEAL